MNTLGKTMTIAGTIIATMGAVNTPVEAQRADAGPPKEVSSEARSMSFEDCQKEIRRFADTVGEAPINLVDSQILRMVRFPASDGSVLVTCSKPDNKMVITRSPHHASE